MVRLDSAFNFIIWPLVPIGREHHLAAKGLLVQDLALIVGLIGLGDPVDLVLARLRKQRPTEATRQNNQEGELSHDFLFFGKADILAILAGYVQAPHSLLLPAQALTSGRKKIWESPFFQMN
jgi:hypothetical protein